MPGQNNNRVQALPIEIARLSELKSPRRNARTHSNKQIRQMPTAFCDLDGPIRFSLTKTGRSLRRLVAPRPPSNLVLARCPSSS
jgi:hypothetical protein